MDELVLLLADPKGKAWDFAKRVCRATNEHLDRRIQYKLEEVEKGYFPDGELYARVSENVRGHKCYFIHDCSRKKYLSG